MRPSIVVIGASPLGRAVTQVFVEAKIPVALSDREPSKLVGLTLPTTQIPTALEDSTVTGIVLAEPQHDGETLAQIALKAGKSVLVVGTLPDPKAVQALAKKHNQHFSMAEPCRYRPMNEALLEALPEVGVVENVSIALWQASSPRVQLPFLATLLGEVRTVLAIHNSIHLEGAHATGIVHAVPGHPLNRQRITIIGDQGTLIAEGTTLTRHPKYGTQSTTEVLGDGLAPMCQAWLAQRPTPTLDPALCAAVEQSAASGKPVPINPNNWFAHPTVQIDGEVRVGEGTKIWHFSKLLGPLTIGARCSLGQNVVVERGVVLGDNVKVQNNVSIYSGVILEDDVFCGPSMVFTNVGTPRSHYPRRGQYLVTRCKQGASIGANATIVCGNTLGRYCFVGAGAVVTKDVPDFALVYGNPARVRAWACYCGATLPLSVDEEGVERVTCTQCARAYTRRGYEVRLEAK